MCTAQWSFFQLRCHHRMFSKKQTMRRWYESKWGKRSHIPPLNAMDKPLQGRGLEPRGMEDCELPRTACNKVTRCWDATFGSRTTVFTSGLWRRSLWNLTLPAVMRIFSIAAIVFRSREAGWSKSMLSSYTAFPEKSNFTANCAQTWTCNVLKVLIQLRLL